MALNGRALLVAGLGSTLVWSGIKGWSLLGTLGDAITGVQPSQIVSNPLILGNSGDPSATAGESFAVIGGSGGSALATVAMQYQGHAYRFGGAPGPDLSRPWDCSSFTNAMVAMKLGKAIPGYGPGKYNGTVHGPPTGAWAIWSGLINVKRSDVQAGDIIIWTGHMGIAISNTRMISALNPSEGTKVTDLVASVSHGPIIRMGRLK